MDWWFDPEKTVFKYLGAKSYTPPPYTHKPTHGTTPNTIEEVNRCKQMTFSFINLTGSMLVCKLQSLYGYGVLLYYTSSNSMVLYIIKSLTFVVFHVELKICVIAKLSNQHTWGNMPFLFLLHSLIISADSVWNIRKSLLMNMHEHANAYACAHEWVRLRHI